VADLINGGFEDFTGWTRGPLGSEGTIMSSFVAPEYYIPGGTLIPAHTYLPVTGDYFLFIETASGSVGIWRYWRQTIDLTAGQIVTGHAAFVWNDYNPFYDGARVQIRQGATVIATPFYLTGDSPPENFSPVFDPPPASTYDYSRTEWTEWTWTCLISGSYTIELAVQNTAPPGLEDTSGSSYGLFDAVTVSTPYEPTIKPLISEEIPLDLMPSNNREGKIIIRQTDPLPTTIINITIEENLGGG